MKLLSAALLSSALLLPSLRAEIENDIPIGIEAVTGVRTNYVYRGFNLGDVIMDFQLEAEVVLQENLTLNAGGWFASEVGDDFTEGAAFADLRYDLNERFTAGVNASYHSYNHTFFENGVDAGGFLTWYLTDDWDVTVNAHRDFAADGWYGSVESGWSYRLSDAAYLAISGGVSAVDHYYGRSGLNDIYGRASLTYNLNRTISLTPFVGWSYEIDDGDGDELFGGLWFEVSF